MVTVSSVEVTNLNLQDALKKKVARKLTEIGGLAFNTNSKEHPGQSILRAGVKHLAPDWGVLRGPMKCRFKSLQYGVMDTRRGWRKLHN